MTLKQKKKHTKYVFIGVLITLILFVLFSFFKTQQMTRTTLPKKEFGKVVKEKLDTHLQKVLHNDDPQQTAYNENLDVTENKVKVVITLADESFVFTSDYGEQKLRYGRYIQAETTFEGLAKLSRHPKIASIAAPMKGTPQIDYEELD